jgi:protein-S-isoprenylcysteine O-methyltransferase Ste14
MGVSISCAGRKPNSPDGARERCEAGVKPGLRTKAFWGTTIFSLAYWTIAFACLVQWEVPNPWARIDFFSGTYLGLRLLGAIHSIASSRGAFRSDALRREWWGGNSGARWVFPTIALMLGELTVFLDYAHWHLMRVLERPALQALGLGLYVCAALWQMWTDVYLARHFASRQGERKPITKGPFRYIRHPRYAGALAGKAALALVFASPLGWLLACCWWLFLLRKLPVEETHLRRLFGAEFDAYAQSTARVLPGLY